MQEKVILSWSGGKDSSLALHELRASDAYQVAALLTTVTEDYDRISMHGVRRTLLDQQAESLGLPLIEVLISKTATNDEYGDKMREVLTKCVGDGIYQVAFGDIFLDDLKKYREENLSLVGMKGIFPVWKRDTTELARTFIALGFKAVVTCVDTEALDKSFAGRLYDESFLSDLPAGIDPCGENGEFHSFAYDGPIFKSAIPHTLGEIVLRENRFCYCDVIEGGTFVV